MERTEGFVTFALTNGPEYHISQVTYSIIMVNLLRSCLCMARTDDDYVKFYYVLLQCYLCHLYSCNLLVDCAACDSLCVQSRTYP